MYKTIGASTTLDDSIARRDPSPSIHKTKGKFRQRRFYMGQAKEANLTSLLKNVNFFKAEK